MNIELQAAAGLLTGMIGGIALGLMRPLLVLVVVLLAFYLVGTLAFDGPAGIGAVIEKIGRSLAAYPVFFSALAIAKAFGCVLALRR